MFEGKKVMLTSIKNVELQFYSI